LFASIILVIFIHLNRKKRIGSDRLTSSLVAAFILTLFAGMSTAVGSLLALFARRTNTRMLSFALGFSGGVMIFLSFADLLPEAKKTFSVYLGGTKGGAAAVLCLLGGLFLAAAIDFCIPSFENPKFTYRVETGMRQSHSASLVRMGVVSAVALTMHNFPEGIATFMAGYSDMRLGVPVAIAVALHNIPEGIAVSVPIFYGTGKRGKAFRYSALSGLSEPLGALAAFFILAPFMSEMLLAGIFAAVAGIMIYISFDELLPSAEKYNEQNAAFFGILAGMILMAFGLFVFH
jgi:ZIP family zinc transporter